MLLCHCFSPCLLTMLGARASLQSFAGQQHQIILLQSRLSEISASGMLKQMVNFHRVCGCLERSPTRRHCILRQIHLLSARLHARSICVGLFSLAIRHEKFPWHISGLVDRVANSWSYADQSRCDHLMHLCSSQGHISLEQTKSAICLSLGVPALRAMAAPQSPPPPPSCAWVERGRSTPTI